MARKNKRYLIKSINFGLKGDLSRNIIEQLEKRMGKTELSKEVRKAVITHFSNRKEFNNDKINQLLNERSELRKQIPEISKQLQKNADQLHKLGYEVEE